MDLSKLRKGEQIAAAAAVLLFVDLFLKWYGVDIPEAARGFVAATGIDTSVSAWKAFDFTDILLFLVVLGVLALVGLKASGRAVPLPVSTSAIIALVGALATLLVFWRILNQPGPNDLIKVKIGAYLGLLLSAGVAVGGWLSMKDEGVSIQDVRAQAEGAIGSRTGATSPPPAPAAAPPPITEEPSPAAEPPAPPAPSAS